MKRPILAVSVFLVSVVGTFAQAPATGRPPFGSFHDGQFDAVNRQNLNTNFAIPIVSNPGRGLDFTLSIVYDSLIWAQTGGTPNTFVPVVDNNGNPTWGWKLDAPQGRISYTWAFSGQVKCFLDGEFIYVMKVTYSNFAYIDLRGTRHAFNGVTRTYNPCTETWSGAPATGSASDGSGYIIDVTNGPDGGFVKDADGATFPGTENAKDTNGNYITRTVWSSTETRWTDTLGRIALKIIKYTNDATTCAPNYSNCIEYQYLAPDGVTTTKSAWMYLKSFNVKADFCTGVTPYDQMSKLLPEKLKLANGLYYFFEYEPNQGDSSKTTARLKKVTLPTGGYYEYVYPTSSPYGMNCTDNTVTNLTRNISDGTARTWTFTRTQNGSNWDSKVTPPALSYDTSGSNESVFTFNSSGQQITAKIYQGTVASGKLLRTINTTWATNGTPSAQTVFLEDITGTKPQTKTVTTFDDKGNIKELQEFDYGAGAPPSSYIRKTTFAYIHESNSNYSTRNIVNRVSSIQVFDSSGTNKLAETLLDYDGETIASQTGVPQHDDANFGTDKPYRGNVTKTRRWLSGSSYLETVLTYDMLGNVKTIQDPNDHSTSIDYADSWNDSYCTFTAGTFAYPTKITNAASQDTRLKYYTCTGQLASVRDPNDYGASRNGTVFAYADNLLRLTQVQAPDGGQTDISYQDSARTVTTQVKRTSSANLTTVDTFNQLGQLANRQLPGNRKIDITYDEQGGQWKVTNPYVSTSDTTYGVVETQVDALGRAKLVKRQDTTSQVQFSYVANAAKAIDEVNRARIVEYDGLGRVKIICEVTSGTSQSPNESCAIAGFSDSGYKTANTYNERDNLTQISSGGQTRSFAYDNLSRLTSATIPEVNGSTSVTYAYDSDSNRITVTDPRGEVCFEYDSLHRLTKKRHGTVGQACTAATVKAEWIYDGTATNNAIGRLITEWDGSAGSGDKSEYVYDPLGRVLTLTRTVSSTGYAMTYEYDYMGNLLRYSYPSSSGTRRKVEYAFNTNGESTSVKDITDSNPSNHFNYVSNAQYSNLGPLSQMDFGSAANPVRTTIGWTKRALIDSIVTQVTGGGATYLNLGYVYHPDGKIEYVKFNNDVNDPKTEKYTYDDLGRLLIAQRGPDTNIQRKYSYDYDRWGNRTAQDSVAGSYGVESFLGFDTSNKNNRITTSGFSYTEGSVTAGNLTANGAGTSFTYNQENFLTAASSTYGTPSYTVDAQGRRVKKTVGSTTTDYFYVGADLVSEKTGSSWKDYIFFAGQRMAEQTGSGSSTAIYLHTDHLGSTRRCTDANGNSAGTCDYEPFGENQPGTTCSVPTRFRFAGMEFDSDTNMYHTWFREYDSTQGRWMSVDPLPGHEDDPQTRNRYVYARNDPVNFRDPFGLDACSGSTADTCVVVIGDPVDVQPFTPVSPGLGGLPIPGGGSGGGGDLFALDLGENQNQGGGGGQGQPKPPDPPKPDCTITFSMNPPLPPNAQRIVQQIFHNAGVAVNFNGGSDADVVVQQNVPLAWRGAFGYQPPGTNQIQLDNSTMSQVATNFVRRQGGSLFEGLRQGDHLLGVVFSHETGHVFLGGGHAADRMLMSSGVDQGTAALQPGFRQDFTATDSAIIRQKCEGNQLARAVRGFF